tara:strand:- start:273 stop:446 length:174 start_codon:yes stop_codon:yes gene_type:complete
MNKPNITVKQFNYLMELLDDDCLGKTPFHCADGECSDRFFTRQHHIMWGYFNVVDAQ